MTPLQALTHALVEVEEQKLVLDEDSDDFLDSPPLGCGDAEAILAALPDDWALIDATQASKDIGRAVANAIVHEVAAIEQEAVLRERKRILDVMGGRHRYWISRSFGWDDLDRSRWPDMSTWTDAVCDDMTRALGAD